MDELSRSHPLAGTFDVVVVGAGVNGLGIAQDAALRGLRVALLEQDDICSGVSAWSGRLVHGGLRYLEHYDFALVRECSASASCSSGWRRTWSNRCGCSCRLLAQPPVPVAELTLAVTTALWTAQPAWASCRRCGSCWRGEPLRRPDGVGGGTPAPSGGRGVIPRLPVPRVPGVATHVVVAVAPGRSTRAG